MILVHEVGYAAVQGGDGAGIGGAGVVGEGFDLVDVGVLGGIDLPQPQLEGGGLSIAPGLVVGCGVRQGGGEQVGASGFEDALGQALADDGEGQPADRSPASRRREKARSPPKTRHGREAGS
jgi:hypothetical protein